MVQHDSCAAVTHVPASMPSSMFLVQTTITGPSGTLSHLNVTICAASLLLTFLLTVHSFALILPRLRSTHHPRLLLLFSSTVLNLGSVISNTWALVLIHQGPATNVLAYYLARSVFFIGFAPLHTIAVLRRILILVASPPTHLRALRLAYLTCLVGFALANAGMWVATLDVMHVGTLDAWMYAWTLPWYGNVAGGVFPLINVVFCAWSLHFAWIHKSVGKGTCTQGATGGGSGTGRVTGANGSGSVGFVDSSPGASSTRGAAGGSAPSSPHIPGTATSYRPPMSTSSSMMVARSMTSFVLSATHTPKAPGGSRDVGEKSVVSAFWYLTLGEIAAWLVYIVLSAAPASLHVPLITKNCVYDVLRVAIIVLEASFEQIYRRRYNRAKEKADVARHVHSSMMVSTVGAYAGAGGGAVTAITSHIVFPSGNPSVSVKQGPDVMSTQREEVEEQAN